jgi:hypothetical protein
MSTLVDIRSSIESQITTLTDQLAPLQAALDALKDDNGTMVSAIVVTDQESLPISSNSEYNSAVVRAERMAFEEAKKEHPTAKRKRDRLYDLLRAKYISEIDVPASESPKPLPNRTRMVKSTKRPRGDRAREILSLHDMGCSPQEIMEETGAHPQYVYKVIRDDRNNK